MVDTKVRIVNKHGEDVLNDGKEVGEIIVKGKGVISEEQSLSDDGWLYTGDLGTMDKDGRIDVVQSNQDINSKEEQLSTFEVEHILTHHSEVEEVSVIPHPHEVLGEIAHAFVVLTSKHSIKEDDLLQYVKHKLAPSNIPVKISFMDELPKTSSGKILKTQLENK